MYLALIWIERLFSTVCFFLSYFSWSVNYMSRVSKFHYFFLTCSETEARCIFKGFWYCHLWKVQYQFSNIFLALFHLVCQLLKSLFSPFLFVSKLYELSVWIIEHILEMSRNISINLYLRPFSIAIYGKFYSCFLYYFRLFLVCNLCRSGL